MALSRLKDEDPELSGKVVMRDMKQDGGDERRAPNGRIAVLAGLSGDLWLGMLCDEGRHRESKVYAGFKVVQDATGKIVSVTKACEYTRKAKEYGDIRRHYYGKSTSPTPWQTYHVPIPLEGRNCQLFTL